MFIQEAEWAAPMPGPSALPLVSLTLALALLSGCLAEGAGSPGGTAGAAPAADEGATMRQAILDQEFTIGAEGPTGSFDVEVPQGTVAVFLKLEYRSGAFQDPSFTLGECVRVTPIEGVAVMAEGGYAGTGSMSGGVLYECGAMAPGTHQLQWEVGNGFVQGHLTVYADVVVADASCEWPDQDNHGLAMNGDYYVDGGESWRETNGIANLQREATCAGPADTRIA